MNTLVSAIALLSIGILPGLAQSASAESSSRGLYPGVGWGKFNLDINSPADAGIAASSIAKSEDDAWLGFAGWRLNTYLAFDAAYINFGRPGARFTATGTSGNYGVDPRGFAPYLVGSLALGSIALLVKAGSYFYDAKVQVDFDNPGLDVNPSHSRNDFLYGGGVDYKISNHITLRMEYETVEIEDARHADALWLTAAWRF